MNGERNKTFKGMLKILINDYQKQHVIRFTNVFLGIITLSMQEEKFYPVVQELMKAQRELQEVKGKLEEVN